MRRPESGRAITRDQCDVVLFDLDGVRPDTASLHAACRSIREVFLQTGE
jgi:beta-phosphoglucomutase-like phosphatase (HAD superfamily)